jgi:hypothetical protein
VTRRHEPGSAKRPDEFPQVRREKVGDFKGGEVAAAGELRPADDVVGTGGERAHGHVGGMQAGRLGWKVIIDPITDADLRDRRMPRMWELGSLRCAA